MLDIFRLLVLNSSTARLLSADAGPIEPSNDGLGGMIARGLAAQAPASRMVALRLACNCFLNPALRNWLKAHSVRLLESMANVADTSNKAFRTAFATTLLNLGVAVHVGDVTDAGLVRSMVLSQVFQVRSELPRSASGRPCMPS